MKCAHVYAPRPVDGGQPRAIPNDAASPHTTAMSASRDDGDGDGDGDGDVGRRARRAIRDVGTTRARARRARDDDEHLGRGRATTRGGEQASGDGRTTRARRGTSIRSGTR